MIPIVKQQWHYTSMDEWDHSISTIEGYNDGGDPIYWTVATINKRREPEHVVIAKLIAAAPDLLEFAEEVRRTGDTRLASMAIAVINKAKGN